jgi:glycerol-3-phosphate acyltransferase PlsY
MIPQVMSWERGAPWFLLAALGGYLLGSIPFGVVVARLRGLGDLRKVGSGNIGATNVLRTGDKKAAAAVLLLDAGKGAVAVALFAAWGPLTAMIAGLSAFLGHLFPVWLRFRGGKGVATFLGVMLALHWPTGLACCALWLATAFATRYSSLSALVAAAASPFALMGFSQWGAAPLAAVLAVMLWLAHEKNIRRLLRGEEPRIRLRGAA